MWPFGSVLSGTALVDWFSRCSQFRIARGFRGRLGVFSALAVLTGSAIGDLPPGWSHTDIGAVGLAGSAGYTNAIWTVAGSGASVCSDDQFQFAYRALNGDGWIMARVE